MPKFTLICDHSCDLDTHVVTHQFNADTYWEVIEQFEAFLRGAGYNFNGALDIVDPIDETMLTVGAGSNVEFGGAGNRHSDHYFDINRNR